MTSSLIVYKSVIERAKYFFETVYALEMTNVMLYKSVEVKNLEMVILDVCLFEDVKGRVYRNMLKSSIRIADSPNDEGTVIENGIASLKIAFREYADDIYTVKFSVKLRDERKLVFYMEVTLENEFRPLRILNGTTIVKSLRITCMEFSGQQIRLLRSELTPISESH